MPYDKNDWKSDFDHEGLAPWHVVEDGVTLCTDEMGFLKLQDVTFNKLIGRVERRISYEFPSYRDRLDAVDIVLEAFENVRKRVSGYGLSLNAKNGFEHYVTTSARRLLVKKSNQCRRVESEFDESVMEMPADSHSPLKRERWLELRRRTVRSVFDDCFKRNSDMKQVVYRSVVNGEDHKDIAKALDTNAENSRQLKKRGLEKLRKAFEKLTDPPWDDGFMEDHLVEKRLYCIRHISSLCERNSNALTLNQWTHSTYCMKNIEKPDRISIASEKTLDRKPSGNRRRRKSTSPHTGISDERFESLLELLRESFHGFEGSKDKP
jgi:RNA polymerase sigma factor (sigma-70 family)